MAELCTQRDLNCLSDPDRSTRKRALEKISKDVQARKGKPDFTPDLVKQNLDLLHKLLLKTMKDPAEKCRELSVTILGTLVPLVTAKDVDAIAGEVRACLGPNEPLPSPGTPRVCFTTTPCSVMRACCVNRAAQLTFGHWVVDCVMVHRRLLAYASALASVRRPRSQRRCV
jgi:hypothetical protein